MAFQVKVNYNLKDINMDQLLEDTNKSSDMNPYHQIMNPTNPYNLADTKSSTDGEIETLDMVSFLEDKKEDVLPNHNSNETTNINLSEMDFANLSEEEYNQFAIGIKNAYSNQIKYLEILVNGEKGSPGYQEILDNLTSFMAEKDAFNAIVQTKQAKDEMINQRIVYYQEYGDALTLLKDTDVSLDEFKNMDYNQRLEFLKRYDEETKRILKSYEETVKPYDLEISEKFGEIGINNYEDFIGTKKYLEISIEEINEMIHSIKNLKESAEYDYLSYLSSYNQFDIKKISNKDLENLDLDANMKKTITNISYSGVTREVNVYSYTDYQKKHPDVSPLDFMRMVKEKNQNNNYQIVGISSYDDLNIMIEVLDKIPSLAKTYNYLYKENPTKADDYLHKCKYEINNIKGQLKAQTFLNSLDVKDGENDSIEAIANELGVAVEGLKDGLDSFCSGAYYSIEALMTGLGLCDENRITSAEEYKKMYILQSLLSLKAKEEAGLITKKSNGEYSNVDPNAIIDYTKEYSGGFLNNNYEISQGIGNMLPSMILSTYCPLAGSAALGISAGGNSYHSAMVEGYDYMQALFYGMASGSTEVITEKFLGGLPGLSNVEVNSLKTWLKAMVKEGNEEVYQNFIDKAYRSIIFEEELKIPTTKEEFINEFKEQGKTWTYGVVTAGILQVPRLKKIFEIRQESSENLMNASTEFLELQNQIASINSEIHQLKSYNNFLTAEYSRCHYNAIITTYSKYYCNYDYNTIYQSLSQKIQNGDYSCLTNDNGVRDNLINAITNYNAYYYQNEARIQQLQKQLSNYIVEYNNIINKNLNNVEINLSLIDEVFSNSASGYGVDQGIIQKNYRIESRYENGKFVNRRLATKSYLDTKSYIAKKYNMSLNDTAMLMAGLDSVGACSHAAAANEIFASYIGQEAKFERDFGFPMYIINEYGKKQLNDIQLLTDLYTFVNHEENGGKLLYRAPNGKTMINLNEISQQADAGGRYNLNGENQQYLTTTTVTKYRLMDSYLKSKNKNIKYKAKILHDQYSSGNFNKTKLQTHISNELAKGNILSLSFYKKRGHITMKNLSGGNDVCTNAWNEGVGHAVFVTGVTNDGFIVSSWGEKYLLSFKELDKKSFIVDSVHIDN